MSSNKFMSIAKQAALNAGKYILNEKKNILSIKQKSDKTFVTHADKEAEKIIKKIILDSYPTHSIYGEEEGYQDNGSDYVWYVDPIDGTHNYMKNFPFYAVSIGLAYKNDVIVGVIYIPEFDELYSAIKDKGAYLNNRKLDVLNIVDAKPSISFELMGNKNEKKEFLNQFIENLLLNFSFRKLGSSACDLALVAKGVLSSHIGFGLKPYDLAAGILIVKEANGIIHTLNKKHKNILFEKHIISANSKNILDKILKVVK